MHNTKDFHITLLEDTDAKNLNELMVSNAKRFERYFPITLSNNLTLELTRFSLSSPCFASELQNSLLLMCILPARWEMVHELASISRDEQIGKQTRKGCAASGAPAFCPGNGCFDDPAQIRPSKCHQRRPSLRSHPLSFRPGGRGVEQCRNSCHCVSSDSPK